MLIAKSHIPISEDAKTELKGDKREVLSRSEICPDDHRLCKAKQGAETQTYSKHGKIPDGVYFYAQCSLDGYKHYKVSCPKCKNQLATVYATDKTLKDWRRARRYAWHDKDNWYGLRGMNKLNNVLRLECCCDPILSEKDVATKYKTAGRLLVKEIK